jgi:hypothetical protein
MLNLKSRLAEVVSSNVFKPFHLHLSYCPVASTVERLIASIIFFILDILNDKNGQLIELHSSPTSVIKLKFDIYKKT